MSDQVGHRVLVTGAAGFIGYHVCLRLLAQGERVTGVDNLNDYYDTKLKKARLQRLEESPDFRFVKLDLVDRDGTENLFAEGDFDRVVHLAAQVGVRNSVEHPRDYVTTNVVGFLNVLEGARSRDVRHLVYASSSSVYGDGVSYPSMETETADRPISVYAATKRADELMAYAYASLYGIPVTGLRFFTVYGPWGRPDMAYFLFTKAISEGRPIDVFNRGEMLRDFTFIDDAVYAIVRVLEIPPEPGASPGGSAPSRIFNVGSGKPISLLEFVEAVELAIGGAAEKRFQPMQPGDVPTTFADVSKLEEVLGFRPSTPLQEGVAKFVDWYREYVKIAFD